MKVHVLGEPTEDTAAVCNNEIPLCLGVWDFCLEKGVLEGSYQASAITLSPGAMLCDGDEVENGTHCWGCWWHLWVSSRRVRHPGELLTLPQARSSHSGICSPKLVPVAASTP